MQSSLRPATYRAILSLDEKSPDARYTAAMAGLHLSVAQCGWPEGVLLAQALGPDGGTPAVPLEHDERICSHPEFLVATLTSLELPRGRAPAGPACSSGSGDPRAAVLRMPSGVCRAAVSPPAPSARSLQPRQRRTPGGLSLRFRKGRLWLVPWQTVELALLTARGSLLLKIWPRSPCPQETVVAAWERVFTRTLPLW